MSGWDDIEQVQTGHAPPAIADIDKLALRVLGSEDGAKLLRWLREQTIEQPCWGPGADPSYGYFLEGRCSLVKELEARLQRARNP